MPRSTPIRSGMQGSLLALAGVLALASTGAGAAPGAEPTVRQIKVHYVSSTAVYVDAGRAEGIMEGDRLAILRAGERIADLEVAFVADHSASCRVTSERRTIQPGDVAVLLARSEEPEPAPPPPPLPPETPTRRRPEPEISELRGTPERPWARLSGTTSVGLQQLRPASGAGGGFDETTSRLSLRLREIGGGPIEARIRLRTRATERLSTATSTTRHYDRLYEACVAYEPPEGRFSLHLGRLAASAFVGIEALDGALAGFRITPRWQVGGFYGRRPEIDELGFQSRGPKYGTFVRFSSTPSIVGQRFAEVVLAGIGEYDDAGEISREYLSLESRFGAGAAWSIFQRAEIDWNRDWRREAMGGASYEVSNVSVAASRRFSERLRFHMTYDQRRNIRTAETREIPEDLFDNLLREGLRMSLDVGRPQRLSGSVSVGARRQEGGDPPTYSGALSLFHNNVGGWSLLLGGDLSYYTGGEVDGYLASLRIRKYFRRGHDLGLTVGASSSQVLGFDPQESSWVRLSTTIELPWRLYLIAEAEELFGDATQGTRWFVELGYRF